MMGTLSQDIRFGVRMLAKRPAFTAIVVLVLAVGIGVNSALFSVFKTVVLSPLPFPQPERIMFVNSTVKGLENMISGPDYVDWREQNQVFSALCAVQLDQRYTLTGAGSPRVMRGWEVTTDFHQVLGVQPYLGRWFLPEDAAQGKANVAILGYRFWKSSFQGDTNCLGTQIVLDGAPLTVVGIAPANLGFLETMTQVFVPMQQDQLNGHRDSHFLFAIGRLKPEVSLQEARAEMTVIAERQAAEYPDTNKYKGTSIVPLHEVLVREVRTVFGISYGAALLVLLIACVNVANLLLVKSMTRCREMAVRCALGAGRLRIVRLVLTESLLLALLGGAAGLLLAFGALDLLEHLLPRVGNQGTPIFDEFKLDTAVLGFTFFIALLSGVLFGIVPAWHASRFNLNEVLKAGARTTTGTASHHRTLNILVGSEVALATVLLLELFAPTPNEASK
jgi:predicted permease